MKLSNRILKINGAGDQDDGWGVFYAARKAQAEGRNITMLTIGDHDATTDDLIKNALIDSLKNNNTKYAAIPGSPSLRETLANRMVAKTGVPTTPENIFVTSGGQGALFAAMSAALDPGDTCVVVDPYYATYPATVRGVSGEMRLVKAKPELDFQLDPAELMEACKGARALLINTPHNPTGAVYNAQTLEAIRAACLEHDLWLITDEVYDSQVHDGEHISPRALPDMLERTIVVNSLSKSHVMTGFRVGWLTGPEEFMLHIVDLANATTYGIPGFVQDAAEAAMKHGAEIEATTGARYKRRRDLAVEALKGSNAIRVSAPQGAMYVMLDVRATGMSGEAFAYALLEKHDIGVMPGESFGTAAAGHIRVALTTDDDALVAALKTLASFAQELETKP